MNKAWLSQLLNHSAFPLLVLALALSQIKPISHKKSNPVRHGREPAELWLDDLLQKSSDKNGSINPSPSALSNKEWFGQ
jgi:hypothetical protein